MSQCRFCLCFSGDIFLFENRSLITKFVTYSNLQLNYPDELPQYCCSICMKKINDVVLFMKQCEESDKVLRVKIDHQFDEFEIKHESSCSISGNEDESITENKYKLNENDGTIEKIQIKDDENNKNATNGGLAFSKGKKASKEFWSEFEIEIKHESSCFISDNEDDLVSENQYQINEDDEKIENFLVEDDGNKRHDINGDLAFPKGIQIEKIYIKDRKKELEKASIEFWSEFEIKTNHKVKKKLLNSGYLCFICGKYYGPGSKNSYYYHLKYSHAEKNLKCYKCSKPFNDKWQRKKHIISCGARKTFECPKCILRFATKAKVDAHMNAVHTKADPISCKICDKDFYLHRNLIDHMRMDHNIGKKSTCSQCDKKFPSNKALNRHFFTHSKIRPFGCEYCEKAFNDRNTLRSHTRLHTGEIPYKCPVCFRGYAQRCNLKSHFRNNHKGMNFVECEKKFLNKEIQKSQAKIVI